MANSLFDKTQIVPLLVKLIGIAGASAVTYGYVTADQVSTIQSALPTVVGFFGVLYTIGYSFYANRKAKQIADVAKMPEVTGVSVNSPDLAAKVAKVAPQTVNTVVAP